MTLDIRDKNIKATERSLFQPMKQVTKKRIDEIISLTLAMLLIFGSFPVDLHARTTRLVTDTLTHEYEYDAESDFEHNPNDEYEYDYEYESSYEYEYDYDYSSDYDYSPDYDHESDVAVIEWLSFSGYVVSGDYDAYSDEDNAPLQGVEISILHGETLYASALTNELGWYLIDAMPFDMESLGEWLIRAALEGFQTEYVWMSDYMDESTDLEINFQLVTEEISWDGSAGIKGIVTSIEDGNPLEGVLVELIGEEYTLYAVTDAYGFYDISIALGDGEANVDIGSLMLGAQLTATIEGFVDNTVRVDDYLFYFDEYGRLNIDFELRPNEFVAAGKVLVEGIVIMDGYIVEGATVTFLGSELDVEETQVLSYEANEGYYPAETDEEDYPVEDDEEENPVEDDEEEYLVEYDDEKIQVFSAITDAEGRYIIELPATHGITYSAWVTHIIEEYNVVIDEYGRLILDEFDDAIIERIAVGVAASEIVKLELTKGDDVEQDFEFHADSGLMRFDSAVTHTITTWAGANGLLAFLNGTLGSNIDNFVLGANISVPTGAANITSGRGFVDGIPFMGTFDGNGFNISANGTITSTAAGLRIRPRSNAETLAQIGRPDLNDFGFIRVAGSGAIIRNVNFHNPRYEDSTSLTQAPAWNTAVGNIGIVIGRVMPGLLPVTIENVNITTAGTAEASMATIVTNGRTVLNKRMGGFVGTVDFGGTLAINNSNVNIMMLSDPSASPWTVTPTTGGMVGQNEGRVLINVDAEDNAARNTSSLDIRGGGRRTHMGGVIGRNMGINSESTIRNISVNSAANGLRTRQAGTAATQFSATGGVIATSASTVPGGVIIENVTVNAPLSIDATDANGLNAVGGIIGVAANANMRNVNFTATLESHRDAGGIIGRASGVVNIDNARNAGGTFTPGTGIAGRGVGGVIGHITATGNTTINDAVNTRAISTARGHLGGIVGRNLGRLTIANSSNGTALAGAPAISHTHTAATSESAGGLVGTSNITNISDSRNFGAITVARNHSGGIIGITASAANSSTTLHNVHNLGAVRRDVNANRHVGGLIGFAQCAVTRIEHSSNSGSVTAHGAGAAINAATIRGRDTNNHIGGLVGRSNRALEIFDSVNTGDLLNELSRPHRIGGLVGGSFGRTEIARSANYGSIETQTRGGTTSAAHTRRHLVGNNLGGIIGRFEPTMGGAASNRLLIIADTANYGNIGLQPNPVSTAGGILGRAQAVRGTAPSIRMTNVQNAGDIRAITFVGGIIGIADQPNTIITGAVNTGNVRSASGAAGQTAAGRRNNTGTGGLIGRVGQRDFTLLESSNLGNVYHTTTERRAGDGSGFGGLIGDVRAAAGTTTIRSSFNAGSVRAHDTWRTGGIVGRKDARGLLLIENVYNIGSVWANLTGTSGGVTSRAGNGILGFHRNNAAAGNVRMINVFNAGNVVGRPIYGEGAAGTIRATRQNFQNVYWDSAVHTGANQIMASGLSGVPTDILIRHSPNTATTVPLLPGLNNPAVWRTGTMSMFNEAREVLENTYPFLAWQTGGEIEDNFISTIRQTAPAPPEGEQAPAILDLAGPAGTRTASFTGVQVVSPSAVPPAGSPPNIPPSVQHLHMGTRVFDPYIAHAAAGTTAGVVNPPVTASGFTRNFSRNGPASIGVINHRGVVAFDVYDRPDVLIVLALDRISGEMVTWANFRHEGEEIPTSFPGSVAIEDAYAGDRIDVTALGYASATEFVTYQQLIDNLIEIPLDRVDMTIHVVVRDASAPPITLGGVLQSPILDTSVLHHNSNNIAPLTADLPNAAMTEQESDGIVSSVRHFVLPDAQWGHTLRGSAQHYDPNYILSLTYYDIVNTEHDLLVVNIPLEDLRIGPFQLRLIEIVPGLEGGEEVDVEQLIRYTDGGGLLLYENPEGFDAMAGWTLQPAVPGTAASTYTFMLPNPTIYTQLQARAAGFRNSDVYELSELIQFDDETGEVLDFVEIIMIPAREFNVRVYEQLLIPGTDIVVNRLIPTAQLEIVPEFHEFVTEPVGDGTFHIRVVVDGDSIYASAPGFEGYVHTFNFYEDTSDTINIFLQRNVEDFLTGFVREYNVADPQAAGIVDAQVTAISINDPGIGPFTATSGIVGFYEIADVPVGTYMVIAAHPDFQTGLSISNPVAMLSGTGAQANVYLNRGSGSRYAMFVRVIDSVTREPIDSANVQFGGLTLESEGFDGLFTHMLDTRATGEVSATAPGYGIGRVMVEQDDWESHHVFITIEMRRSIDNIEVHVVDNLNTLLTGATLLLNDEVISGSGGIFFIPLAYVGDILSAGAPGFVSRDHSINGNESTPLVIQLTEHAPIPSLTVHVMDLDGITPLPSATLIAPGRVVERHNNGTFTVTGAFINDILSAAAPGFVAVDHTINAADANHGTITITLNTVAPEPLTVHVRDARDNSLLPTAKLMLDGIVVVVSATQGIFSIPSATIGQMLEASAPGFVAVMKAISASDMAADHITIVLDVNTNEVVNEFFVEIIHNGTRVDEATLIWNGTHTTVDGTFYIDDVYVGAQLEARVHGFVDVTHTITPVEFEAESATITLTDADLIGVDNFVVEVEDANGDPILTATLNHGGGAPISTSTATFTLNDVVMGDSLNVSAPGFLPGSHTVNAADIVAGGTVITMTVGFAQAADEFFVEIVHGGVRVGEATLTHNALDFTTTDGTFTLVDRVNVLDALSASVPGFNMVNHYVSQSEFIARSATITLTDADLIGVDNFVVEVEDANGDPILSATLIHGGGTPISTSTAMFTLDNVVMGDSLNVSAPGFLPGSHTVNAADIVAGGTVITLAVDFAQAADEFFVEIVHGGVRVGEASLTHNALDFTTTDGTFTLVDRVNVLGALSASVPGFNMVNHQVSQSEFIARSATITLTDADLIGVDNFVVEVEDANGNPILTATLIHGGGTPISTNTATFTLDNVVMGDSLNVSAPGFLPGSHTVSVADIIAGGTVITLAVDFAQAADEFFVEIVHGGVRVGEATLTHNALDFTTTDGTFALVGRVNVLDMLSASVPGFNTVNHYVSQSEFIARSVTITLTDADLIGIDNFVVDVEDANGNPILTATLIHGGGTPISTSTATFTLNDVVMGDSLNVSAPGFLPGSHAVNAADIVAGGTVITLTVDFAQVADEFFVEIVHGGVRVGEATLTHNALDFTTIDGTFTLVNRVNVLDTLSANVPGFNVVNHYVSQSEFIARSATITLTDADLIGVDNFVIEVEDANGDPILTATLIHGGGTPTSTNTATFTLDNVVMGDSLNVSAPGFLPGSHTVNAADIVAGGTVITLAVDFAQVADEFFVEIVHGGVRVGEATLTHNALDFTTIDGTFTLIDRVNVLDMLSASVPGFNVVNHHVSQSEFIARSVTITLTDADLIGIDNFVVEVEDANGNPILTATLIHGGGAPISTSTAMFTLNDVVMGDSLNVSAPGFLPGSHTVNAADIVAGGTVITMTVDFAQAADEFFVEIVHGGVRVGEATLTHNALDFTTTDGTFALVGRVNVLDMLSASVPGFNVVNHHVSQSEFIARSATITLTDADLIGVDNFVVEVRDITGAPIPTAVLTHEGVLIAGNGGIFIINSALEGDALIANALGFGQVEHTVTIADVDNAGTTIILTAIPINSLVVRVVNTAGELISMATLTTRTGVEAIINGNGIFTLNSVLIGDILTATAPYHNTVVHTVTAIDAAAAVIVITLSGDGSPLPPSPERDTNESYFRPLPHAPRPTPAPVPMPTPPALITDQHVRYVIGFEDGTVRPNTSITRAETAMIIFRLLEDEVKFTPIVGHFWDVDNSNWYAQAINYLAHVGVLQGYPDGAFRPNSTISRAELAAMMSRFFAASTTVTNSFTDIAPQHWAVDYINSAYSRGWILGYGDSTFRPDNAITRAETITLINRVLGRVPNPETINASLDGHIVFSDLSPDHWAFYDIMEAAIEHGFVIANDGTEVWTWFILPAR